MIETFKIYGMTISLASHKILLDFFEKEESGLILAPLSLSDLLKSFFFIKRTSFYKKVDYFYVESKFLQKVFSLFHRQFEFFNSAEFFINTLERFQDRRTVLLGLPQKDEDLFLNNVRRIIKGYKFMGMINRKIAELFQTQSFQLMSKIDPHLIIVNASLSNRVSYVNVFNAKKQNEAWKCALFREAITIYLKRFGGRKSKTRLLLNFLSFLFSVVFNFLLFPLYLFVLFCFLFNLVLRRK